MTQLRIYETPAGAMCGGCTAEKYGLDHPDVYGHEWGWTGGYCAECWLTMPADGDPDGREEAEIVAVYGRTEENALLEQQRAAWRAYREQDKADRDVASRGIFGLDLLAGPSPEAQVHLDRAGDYALGRFAADAQMVGAADSCSAVRSNPPDGSNDSFIAGWCDRMEEGL